MLLLLLVADTVAKVGAAIGGDISVISADIGIGRIGDNVMDAMARQPEKIGDLCSSTITTAALVEGAAFLSIITALPPLFVQKLEQQMVFALPSADVENTLSTGQQEINSSLYH